MEVLILAVLTGLFIMLIIVLMMRRGLGEAFASVDFGESFKDWWRIKKARYLNAGLAVLMIYWAMPAQVDAFVWPLGATKKFVYAALWPAQKEITTTIQSVGTAQVAEPTEVVMTPTPEPVTLRVGFQGFDKPTEDTTGGPKAVVPDVGKLEYTVIGAWQCWPIPPIKPYIQVRLTNPPEGTTLTDVWVLRGALPEDDGSLAVKVNSATQHGGAVCQ